MKEKSGKMSNNIFYIGNEIRKRETIGFFSSGEEWAEVK